MQAIKTFLIQQTKFRITAERIGERLDIEAPRGARLSVQSISGMGYQLLNEGARLNIKPETEEQIIERLREFLQGKAYLSGKK